MKIKLFGAFLFLCFLILLFFNFTFLQATEKEFKPVLPKLQIEIPGLRFRDAIVEDEDGQRYLNIPWIADFISAFFKFFISAIAIIATVMIMWAGLLWLTAAGSASQITQAKTKISNALIGLVIALGSYLILHTVNPTLVKLKSIKILAIKRIELELAELEKTSKSAKDKPIGGWIEKEDIKTYNDALKLAAQQNGLNCTLLKAIMLVESGGRPKVVSSAGACGLMQLLPVTASQIAKEELGKKDEVTCDELKNPPFNIQLGAKYFRRLINNPCPKNARLKSGKLADCTKHPCGCSVKEAEYFAVAAYNGGPGANCCSTTCKGQTWWECEENPGFSETRNYVKKVFNTQEYLIGKGWDC